MDVEFGRRSTKVRLIKIFEKIVEVALMGKLRNTVTYERCGVEGDLIEDIIKKSQVVNTLNRRTCMKALRRYDGKRCMQMEGYDLCLHRCDGNRRDIYVCMYI